MQPLFDRPESLRSAKRHVRLLAAVLLSLAAVILVSAATAASGDLDPAFGSAGKVITDFDGITDEGHAVVVQADGKIVVGGFTSGPTLDFALARYLADGSLDGSFGAGGKVVTSFPGDFAFINALLAQPDGKIVAVGATGAEEVALARYNPDGTLDPSFGAGGRVQTPVGSGGYANAAALQADGKIIVVGQLFTGIADQGLLMDALLVRYEADGTLDADFGNGGILLTDTNFLDDARSVAVQADGKIVTLGATNDINGSTMGDYLLTRYNTDGTLDAGFGDAGKRITNFVDGNGSHLDSAAALAIQADGKIVAAGTTFSPGGITPPAFFLARYDTNGNPDPSFAGDGQQTTIFPGFYTDTRLFAVLAQPDGKIVAAGSSGEAAFPATLSDFALARYNPNGSPDSTFGASGVLTSSFGDIDVARGVALQTDGNLVAAGFSTVYGGETKWALSRYLAVGVPDTTPPQIGVPATMLADATSPMGAAVFFDVVAEDDVDGRLPTTCVPESDSEFPIGDTEVVCEATDAAGNTASASFVVHVKGAPEQIADFSGNLAVALGGAAPPRPVREALERAAKQAAGKQPLLACVPLSIVSEWVRASVQLGKIGSKQGNVLLADIARIKGVIGC